MDDENRDKIFGALTGLFEFGHWRIYRNYMGMDFALLLHSDKFNFDFEIELDDKMIDEILTKLNECLGEYKQEVERGRIQADILKR